MNDSTQLPAGASTARDILNALVEKAVALGCPTPDEWAQPPTKVSEGLRRAIWSNPATARLAKQLYPYLRAK